MHVHAAENSSQAAAHKAKGQKAKKQREERQGIRHGQGR